MLHSYLYLSKGSDSSTPGRGWGRGDRWRVPVTELEAGRAWRAMSGGDGLWLCRTCIWCVLDMACWPPSAWIGGASRGCWEGAEAAGRCCGRIFSAISCSLILLIKTRLSSWQPGTSICDKRTAISSVRVTSRGDGSPQRPTRGIAPKHRIVAVDPKLVCLKPK